MPALRLLTPWPWGCPTLSGQIPQGNFRFAPINIANNYWLKGDLAKTMRWYYQVKTWRLTAQPFFQLSNTAVGARISAKASFASADAVVCGRGSMKILAQGTTPSGYDMSAELILFLPTGPDFQGNDNLLEKHSVVKLTENDYRAFCYVSASYAMNPSGSTRWRFESNQPNFLSQTANLLFDGQLVKSRKTFHGLEEFGVSWRIAVDPVEFFDFSD